MHRMSLREVQEVARLAADTGAPVHGGGPTVHKVADALGLPPSEVELLLDQARQGRSPIRDFKIVAGVVALIVAFLLGLGTTNLVGKRATPASVATVPQAPAGTVLASPNQGVASEVAVQTSRGGAVMMSNGATPQYDAEGGLVETKTTDGDFGNSVDKARRSLPEPVTMGGRPGMPQPVSVVVAPDINGR